MEALRNPDDPILRQRGNQMDVHDYTAIGARIAGA